VGSPGIRLGKHGIACILIEQKPAPQFLPKMERCNVRTTEMFRRPGLAEKIRAAGLQSHLSMDIFVILAMNKRPLLDQHYQSVSSARRNQDQQ
jgi:FAD binding domain